MSHTRLLGQEVLALISDPITKPVIYETRLEWKLVQRIFVGQVARVKLKTTKDSKIQAPALVE